MLPLVDEKLKTFLGLARRSGQLESGVKNIETLLKANRLGVVIIASDAAENAKDKIKYWQEKNSVPCFVFLDKDALGQATGQTDKAVVAVKPGDLADAIINLLDKN